MILYKGCRLNLVGGKDHLLGEFFDSVEQLQRLF
jgi:hypothetical protein